MSRQITLPLETLRDLIFGFDGLASIDYQSVTTRAEVYFPVIIPRPLGDILEELNTDNLFVIKSYPTHSEVWHRRHWDDSASRRWDIIAKSAAATKAYDELQLAAAAKADKITKIKTIITNQPNMAGLADTRFAAQLHNMAVAMLNMDRETCRLFPGLEEILYESAPNDI